MSIFTKIFVEHSDRYFKTKWRAPRPTHRDILRRAAEGGMFSSCAQKEIDELASALLDRPVRLDRASVLGPWAWDWLVDYGKK